ncbi:MAG: tetratricopeptide repeat protein [Candidatus Rokubacteria bacterium]|nr:tetratricopeptide repeat protein [Candidatus Rokubacteria bacterium]
MRNVVLVVLALGLPALAFALWPLVRRGGGRGWLALPPEPTRELEEEKGRALRALRELEFEHDAGHVSDEDYATVRARYEQEAAVVLRELDRLGAGAPPPAGAPPARAVPGARAWRHPLALGAVAVVLVAFGVTLGVGIVRYTEPDPMAGAAASGPPPMAGMAGLPPEGGQPAGGPPTGGGAGAPRPITPEILQRMLQAARVSLNEGRYGEAISAYQAILKRDAKNVDAMTHLGLIVAIGGHADAALETFDKALAIDPRYPPALLYRGQVLYEAKQDAAGAIRAWERFLAVVPDGEDRKRVEKLIADARAKR